MFNNKSFTTFNGFKFTFTSEPYVAPEHHEYSDMKECTHCIDVHIEPPERFNVADWHFYAPMNSQFQLIFTLVARAPEGDLVKQVVAFEHPSLAFENWATLEEKELTD